MAKITYTLKDFDAHSGQVTSSYVLSENIESSNTVSLRIDQITKRAANETGVSIEHSLQRIVKQAIEYLNILFLPVGFPHSVTDDYVPYQIYDSIQAFASSIAGLLSARAVLQSLDVISASSSEKSNSTSAATAATLLSILQSTLANVTSILFASHAAPRISAEVKYYRFLADVVNDAAFILDLLAPMLASSTLPILFLLPISPRSLVLCASSILRAICGVAGGSSKAVLSTHFARSNPDSVGDLNAKDGSQETVVGLLGMWVGGLLVSRVESHSATWCWMIALLCLHLWANFQAVSSIKLRSLNRERASLICNTITTDHDKADRGGRTSMEAIRATESVLGTTSFCRSALESWRRDHNKLDVWKTWVIGMPMQQFLQSLNQSKSDDSRSTAWYVNRLRELFEAEAYVLHWDRDSGRALVMLKVNATATDQLKSWLHASCLQARAQSSDLLRASEKKGSNQLTILQETLSESQTLWETWLPVLEAQGWDLKATNLETRGCWRLEIKQD